MGGSEPFLFVVLEAKANVFEPSRHCLGGIDRVVIGRGTAPSFTRKGSSLGIELADAWMSSKHATIERRGNGFVVRDAGSRNQTFVNGKRIEETKLESGDILEVGNTFLLFRDAVPRSDDDDGDLVASSLAPPLPELATLSPTLARTFERLASVARSKLSVFLGGEKGTGKELAARAIHSLSQRRGAFVSVSCAAIDPTRVASELFGREGATEDRPGLVRAADGGTLFLDEVGELPLPVQGALLRVLEQHEVVPVGATKPVPVDLRIVTATHRDLDELVAEKTLQADLRARILGLAVKLPPLRDRLEDLGLLARRIFARAEHRSAALDLDAARALLEHDWPLNIRELERRLSAAVVLAGGAEIRHEHVFPDGEHAPQARPSRERETPL